MVRDYQKLLRSEGVLVPRWVVLVAVSLVLLWVGLKILVPPRWIVQRLDSPDGQRSAMLMRSQYLKQNFEVHVKDGGLWHTAYYSDPVPSDNRLDLGERLAWSDDSSRLYFRLQGRFIWGYDFSQARALAPAELGEVRPLHPQSP